MATTAAVLSSERWLDEVVLTATLPADVAGAALSESITIPPGLGDLAILSIHFRATGVDVGPAAASTVPRGVRAMVNSSAANLVDTLGVAEWFLTFDGANALEYSATIDPDALCLWRQSEFLSITSPELDSDATPTGDVLVFIKCVRVHPVELREQPSPIRLVR